MLIRNVTLAEKLLRLDMIRDKALWYYSIIVWLVIIFSHSTVHRHRTQYQNRNYINWQIQGAAQHHSLVKIHSKTLCGFFFMVSLLQAAWSCYSFIKCKSLCTSGPVPAALCIIIIFMCDAPMHFQKMKWPWGCMVVSTVASQQEGSWFESWWL